MEAFKFTNDKPIYIQLIEVFKCRIVAGELKPGDRLDSVRDLAVVAQVNPNTMQKALSELEKEGLVRTERNSGRYITDDSEVISNVRVQLSKNEVESFVQKMVSLGFTKKDVIKLVNEQDF
ncbi:MAG TPA: GntR family transcriptional regulator [Treponema sp.]|jgi:DNA-binding transcriptional regulator YhcF (GntR family)|nr:GntR family transcriptional regulator [Treponema sp.]HCA20093.1 GntR family transcriptional regulator [Treponema sp.]